MHRWLSRVRLLHWKAHPAKLHHAATHVDREDDPATGKAGTQASKLEKETAKGVRN